ncbi:MAG: hypothetical protein K6G26_06965 [Lachnospiraceae bacterium]|nr:hypothetical protein [Lachnospiraceae bacterium]
MEKKKKIYLFITICGGIGAIASGINAIVTANKFIRLTFITSIILYIIAVTCFYIDYKNSLKK